MMNKLKLTLLFVPIGLIIIVGLWHEKTVDAMPSARSPLATNAQQIEWETNTQVTSDAVDKEAPTMRVSPDGETLLIAYNAERLGHPGLFDVMYAESEDQGASWSTSTIQAETGASGKTSSQVDLEYDASGTAHAVWKYGTALAYGRYGEWGADTPFKLLHDDPSGILYPNIVTSGDEVVDVLWSASSTIKHVRSDDGGDSWDAIEDISSVFTLKTSIDAVAQTDKLHVVWEDVNFTNLVSGTIHYSQGDATGSPIIWSPPITLSNSIAPNIHDAREAAITINDGSLYVTYTDRQSRNSQWVHVTTCQLSLDCTQIGNWVLDSTPISGDMLGVNAEAPWNVFSDLVSYNGCVYAHFHGTTTDYAEENELIWSTNSCNNWAANGRRELTNPQVQALFPSATVNGSRVYLAYGRNPIISDPYHQIFFRRSAPTGRNVYLPVILK